MATEKIMIQIGDEVKELKGAEKETYFAQRQEDKVQFDLVEAEYKAKQDARDSAIKKLGEIAGLTEEEIEAII
jgi:hypothetical protein